MNLILMANKFQNENEFKFWLKEYKHFIMFMELFILLWSLSAARITSKIRYIMLARPSALALPLTNIFHITLSDSSFLGLESNLFIVL